MRAENQRIPEAVFRVFVVTLLVLGGIIGAVLACAAGAVARDRAKD